VQVLNFVAKGTIEEGMLSLLAFKKSLFAGVLDGGQSEVMLQGTRLSKFMETVEQVTGAKSPKGNVACVAEETAGDLPLEAVADTRTSEGQKPESGELGARTAFTAVDGAKEAQVAELPTRTASEPPGDATGTARTARTADPWAPLLSAGIQFLDDLAAAAKGEARSPFVETDPATGQSYLKLPMPQPEAVERLAAGLLMFLGSRQ